MTNQKRLSLFALITLLTLVVNLMFPVSVLADDETPPLPVPTEEIILDEEPTPQTDPQPDSVPEVLEQLPENTEIIVLDESGEPIPLVTEEAEEAIIVGDPVWCPSSLSAPTPGANGCTSSYLSFQDLIDYLDANEQAMDGTIWIESSYNSSVNDPTSSGFVFDSGAFTTMSNYALTIQGGWNGVSGSSTIGSASVFSGDYLVITNWNGNVTLNDIAISGASGSNGITVVTNGAVNLSDVSVQNSDQGGVYIDNQGGTGTVSISNSQFSNNDYIGLEVYSSGDIILNNVIANGNDEVGAYLENCGCSNGNVFVTNSQFNNNNNDGLVSLSAGNITLNNVIASDNSDIGVFLDAIGTISITNSRFNSNGYGLEEHSEENIILSNVIANDNDYQGALLYNIGNISITNSQFNNNGDYGFEALSAGNITLNSVIANSNGDHGIFAFFEGNITLNNVVASDNLYNGAELFNCGCAGIVEINVFGSTFNNNGYIGLTFLTNGSVNIENTTANNNGVGGIGGDAYGNVTVFNVTANNNPNGLGFATPGNVTIKCSTVTNNGLTGVEVYSNNLDLIGSSVTNNGVDYFNGVGTINVSDYDCNPSKPNKPSSSGLSLNIVQGSSADLDCDKYSGTVLILPNGDKVTFKCPIGGSATLNPLTSDGLPNELPEGVEFVSGMLAVQSPDGNDVALDGLVVVDFIIPENLKNSDFAILYWNGSEWIDLGTATFDDGRKVFNSGYVTEDGYFEALINFSGNFVLVAK